MIQNDSRHKYEAVAVKCDRLVLFVTDMYSHGKVWLIYICYTGCLGQFLPLSPIKVDKNSKNDYNSNL